MIEYLTRLMGHNRPDRQPTLTEKDVARIARKVFYEESVKLNRQRTDAEFAKRHKQFDQQCADG